MPGILGALAAIIGAAYLWRSRTSRWAHRHVATRLPPGPGGIIPGAETIDLPRAGAPAVLLVHGGGDTPQALGLLAEYLYGQGYAVRAPLLPGHGRTLSDFARVTADDWLHAVRQEYLELARSHQWTGLVGLSMGGAIAVQIAADVPALPALVLLSPYLSMPPRLMTFARLAPLWGRVVPFVRARGELSIHDPREAALARGYGVFSAAALHALWATVLKARAALPRVTAPVLVIQSTEDNRIAVRDAERAFELVGSAEKNLEWVEGAGHVITVDYGRERVFARTAQWLDAHGGQSARAKEGQQLASNQKRPP